MKLVTVTAPTEEPVNLSDAKAQVSIIDDTSHDARLLRLIKAARLQAEAHTGMRAMTQTVRLELDSFPGVTQVRSWQYAVAGWNQQRDAEIDLGVYPVQSITSVQYDDINNVQQTLTAGTDFYADIAGLAPRILPVDSWPDTRDGKPGAVRITMVVGYASADLVPEDFSQAVLLRMAELFDQTTESVQGISNTAATLGFELLLAPHRRMVV
jgi:uncharacterized phiE125 gp8 family phage protein